MGKRSLIFVLSMFAALSFLKPLYGAQRKVLAEMFTNTGCGPCGPANPALDRIYESHPDIMTVIRYHVWWPSSTDPFYQENVSENTTRTNYYGVNAVPNLHIDGHIDAGYQYSQWENRILGEAANSTPVTIQLQLQYNLSARTGTVISTVESESTITSNSLKLFYVVIEDSVYYPAPNGEEWHNQIMRDMIPDAYGKPITLTQGVPVVDTAEFTIDQSWNETQCFVVVFVQDYVTKWVYQSEIIAVLSAPLLKFDHFNITDGNNNIPDPGDTVTMHVYFKNTGRTEASNIYVEVQSEDPYVHVLSSAQTFDSLAVGEIRAADFQLYIDPACPDSYRTDLILQMSAGDSLAFSDTFPFLVDITPGLVEDFEDELRWRHYGRNGIWHTTEHRHASPTHSLYNGFENYWFYADNAEVYIESPFILVGDNHMLRFWHCYWIENEYDFGYVEISPDSSRWITVAAYTGIQSSWTEAEIDLSDYVGSPIKLRFKFQSDGSVHYEGWYIDDITVNMTSVEEHGRNVDMRPRVLISVAGDVISLQIPETGTYSFEIYDIVGRRVGKLFDGRLSAGSHSFRLPQLKNGVYFFVAKSPDGLRTSQKFVYVR